jgi:WD40 repeat protein
MKTSALLVVLTFALCLLNACGGSNATPPPPAAPTVTIAASSGAIMLGQKVTLTWMSTDATSCTASANPSQSDWSGPEPVSGSASVTPAAPGTITYTLGCTGVGGSASHDAPVAANIGTLSIPAAAPPDGTVGSRYNPHLVCTPGCACSQKFSCWRTMYGFPLSATGGLTPYSWSWVPAAGSGLPPGLGLGGNTISGIPTTAGSYQVAVTVTDSQSPAARAGVNYTISIHNPPPPTISTDPPPSAPALNLPYTFAFAATGYAPLSWSEAGALPPGLAFGTDGTLSGTPTKIGSYPLRVTVRDGLGQVSAPDDVTIEVFPHGFKLTGSMTGARTYHTATLLTNGKVLVTGGADDGGVSLATAELFDPASGTFASTGSMSTARHHHTATLLNNGKVLVTGGDANGTVVATAELFDPAIGNFMSTGSMTAARVEHTATLLNDGRVLVTGGVNQTAFLATAELFDPATGTFTATTDMTHVRISHRANLLNDGKVLVTGGTDGTGPILATAELFDPARNIFASTGSMSTARRYHAGTLLTSGKVLVTGGADSSGGGIATAELYDSPSGTFTSTGDMRTAHSLHTAVLLKDGTVLVMGGGSWLAELYDETLESFAGTGSLTTPRTGHTATLLSDGRVLVTGGVGSDGGAVATAELYQ